MTECSDFLISMSTQSSNRNENYLRTLGLTADDTEKKAGTKGNQSG